MKPQTSQSSRDTSPEQSKRDLRFCLLDGLFFSLMVGTGEHYLPAFALALGQSEVIAGMIVTVPILFGAIVQLIAPAGVLWSGSFRRWVVWCVIIQAAVFLPLIAGALAGSFPSAALFLAASIYWATGMAAGPAWNSWVETLVPKGGRAEYFAKRNRLLQIGTLGGLITAGWILSLMTEAGQRLQGFAIIFLLAGLYRAVSAVLLQKHSDLPAKSLRMIPLRSVVKRFRSGPESIFLLYMLAVTFTANIASPFFGPYMLKELNLEYDQYKWLLAATFTGKTLALTVLARFAPRVGGRSLLWFGGVGIIPLPALWLISDAYPYLVSLQLLGGIMWGAYELAVFLMVFDTIPMADRTSMLSTYNLLNAILMVIGTLIGAAILDPLTESGHGYTAVFAVSTGARALTLILLAKVAFDRVLSSHAMGAASLRPASVLGGTMITETTPRGAKVKSSTPPSGQGD